ncbi:MAG: RIP metalloprotease RseP [Sphingomonas sp.]
MTHSPGLLLTILAFALVIGPLVFLHELGHYLAGRVFGVKAEVFSIGFGNELFGWTDKRGTRWKLSAFPLGGYVRFAGDMNAASQPDADWLMLPPEERARAFPGKPVWQRAIIVAAGPVMNFIIAIVILAGFALAFGVNDTPPVIGSIQPGSPAANAKLAPADRIVALGGRSVENFADIAQFTVLRPGETIQVDYVRDGVPARRALTIGAIVERDRFGNETRIGRLGIEATTPVLRSVGLLEAPLWATKMTGEIVQQTLDGLGQIISGRRSVDELGGPLRIAKVSGEQLSLGWAALVWFIAMISINLGFINLLPVPMLDGGHLFFYAIEAVRRKPVEPQVQEWAFRGGLAALLALMLLVTFNDLGSFGLWTSLHGLIG